MGREVELSALDLRYESYRMKNPALEARLLACIAERGIEEPLEGVEGKSGSILLNGFKRYRCAVKLALQTAPYASLGEEEAGAIIQLLRRSNTCSLTILEQAGFIDDLHQLHQMSVAEMAEQLSRSKSWVSMRLGLIGQMSPAVREKIFAGAFPVYPYMYTLRQFMRMNGVARQEIEAFVLAVAGRRLSVREIERLAQGYFRGPESFREAIRQGHLGPALEWIRQVPEDPDGCNAFEGGLLRDLEIVSKYMRRVLGKSQDRRLKSPAFHAQANLLTAGILSLSPAFFQTLRRLHDRSGQAPGGLSAAPGRDERAGDGPPLADQPEHGAGHHRAKRGHAGAQAPGPDRGRSRPPEATLPGL